MSYDKPIHLVSGIALASHMEDQLGRLAIFYGRSYPYFWEPVTTRLIQELLKEGQTALLAGSHVGLMALYARKAMLDTAIVYTFEPISHLYQISARNFTRNKDLGTIILENKALGEINTTVQMQSYNLRSKIIEGEIRDDVESEEVAVVTIDSYCHKKNIPKLDLVLLDVEGYELNALKGMEKLLSTNPPRDIVYEISFPKKDNLQAAHAIETYLKPFGYNFYIIEDVYDVMQLDKKVPNIVTTPATTQSYEDHRNHQYFNMFATLRSQPEVAEIQNQ